MNITGMQLNEITLGQGKFWGNLILEDRHKHLVNIVKLLKWQSDKIFELSDRHRVSRKSPADGVSRSSPATLKPVNFGSY